MNDSGDSRVIGAETVTQRYVRIGGFTHGFDYLRIILAVSVLLEHSVLSSYGRDFMGQYWGGWERTFLAPILLMFFALSGFLVSGSLKKHPTVTSFMTLRAVRIVPALAVEVLLSALILGPLLSKMSLTDYVLNKGFIEYFLNIVGWIHFRLPGVFVDLPFPNVVNLSLWTVPYELECYVALMALYLVGMIRKRETLLLLILVAILIGSFEAFRVYDAHMATDRPLPRSLLVAFLVGVALNLYSDRIRLSKWIALGALAAMVLTTLTYQTIYLATVPAGYLAVYFGMMHPRKIGPLFTGDYSYGLYLFAFPIQQSFTYLFPQHRGFLLNAAFTLVLGFAYAAFSWWCVERPLLSRKAFFVRHAEAARSKVIMALRSLVPRGKGSAEADAASRG